MKTATSLLLLILAATPAHAADTCMQENAIYSGAGGYGLSFRPVGSDAAALSHRFEMTSGSVSLSGVFIDSEAPVRSIAHIEKDCPEGDVTGDDIAACTAFEGYVYAISPEGAAGNIPRTGEKAAANLLLSGLGPSLAVSPLSEKLKLQPPEGDLFTFKECAP